MSDKHYCLFHHVFKTENSKPRLGRQNLFDNFKSVKIYLFFLEARRTSRRNINFVACF